MIARLAGLALALGMALGPGAARGEGGWEYRLSAGGEINADPHGTFDLGFRKGAFSVEVLTDTLEVRYAPQWSRGKVWVAARGEALFAGLLMSPWRDGAPDPASALYASYGGLEAGGQLFLRHAYLGLAASERVYAFSARGPETTVAVPPWTSLLSVDAMVGHWEPAWQVEGRIAVDLESPRLERTRAQPRATLFAAYHPPRGEGVTGAPLLELRAGWGVDQGALTRTRLGGLNPYVVPLAGAAWAELRVERFVAARLGMVLGSPRVEGGLLVDAAAFDGQVQAGFGALVRARFGGRWFAEGTVGWAPWLPRQGGAPAISGYLLVGTGWGPLRSGATRSPRP